MWSPVDDVPMIPGSEEVRKNPLQDSCRHDTPEKVVQDHPLVMEPHLLLNLLERQDRGVSPEIVVEPEHESLELGHDHVLVVARIADDRALVPCARKVARLPDRRASRRTTQL